MEKLPAPGVRLDKEITDVFEYLLIQSGRLIVHIRSESRAVVLDNILFIKKKETLLTQLQGTLQVNVRSERGRLDRGADAQPQGGEETGYARSAGR